MPGLHVDDAGHADADSLQRNAVRVLGGKNADGIAHLTDDVVFAQRDPRAQRDFFHQVTLLVDGRDAQIGAAEINADRKVGHR